MDDYAGRVLADRYRLPLPPSDEYEFTESSESRAFDTYSGQEVLVRQVPLPEVLEAEVLDADGLPDGFVARDAGARRPSARTTRRPAEPAVRRAIEAAQAAAQIPDHPRLDQVFDVFAEGGSLWIVSELVAARSLDVLLAEQPLSPYRAAEVAADVLTALRVLHAHGWVHRNITARTVLVCDDGRVMLTGLAVGAAEEALCGYDPVPDPAGTMSPPIGPGPGAHGAPDGPGPGGDRSGSGGGRAGLGPGAGAPGRRVPLGGGTASGSGSLPALGRSGAPGGPGPRGAESGRPASGGAGPSGPGAGYGVVTSGLQGADAEAARRAAIEARAMDTATAPDAPETATSAADRALEASEDIRAARAGAIAAYRAGARAAARVQGEQHGAPPALPGPRPAEAQGETQALPQLPSQQRPEPYTGSGTGHDNGAAPSAGPASPQHGRIADPYGVSAPKPWHGAVPRTGPHTGPGPAAQDDARTTDNGRAPSPYTPPGAPSAPKPYAQPPAPAPAPAPPAPPRRGPATALAAERARQARMAVVGPVTERWAPEQAGPVHENWQLAAPIGPATDLWALGALLFRAVQGHAPYPEESTAELVELVVSEPPAYAEECGPLRPVVESLLRQDPTERLDFEELRGWLRSLVRSAPEPDAGADVVIAPPVDPRRLPIVRRRGELVRKRRAGLPATSGRHKRARDDAKPRRLGRNLVLLILLAMAAAIAYAMYFMPKTGQTDNGQSGKGQNSTEDTGAAGAVSPAPSRSARQPEPSPSASASKDTGTQTDGAGLPQGFGLRKDPEGFELAVATGWDRQPKNARGQVIYYQGNFELIVVPGRDSTKDFSGDPMTYQRESEPELQPFRDSTWATSSGMRRVEVGGKTMAEGQFTWTDGEGKELYVRNLTILDGGRYHVVQLRGPESERDQVTRLYEQASATYRTTG